MPLQDALDAVDDLVSHLDGLGYVRRPTTAEAVYDTIFWELAFSGIEFDDNDTNPGGMPRLAVTLSVNYGHEYLEQEKQLMEAGLTLYPHLVSVSGGQVDDDRISYFPDPDQTTRPARIGISFTFTHRAGLVSLKD